MPFKPRIAGDSDGWDDEADDFPLPGDLAELGNQLRDDALHLARLHPPWRENDHGQPAGKAASGNSAKSTSHWQISTALGALVSIASLLLVTTGILVYRLAGDSAPDSTPTPGVNVVDESVDSRPRHGFALADNVGETWESNRFAFPPVLATPRTRPSTPLLPHDASMLQTGGPRAEAYLDYIEMTTVRNVKLSF